MSKLFFDNIIDLSEIDKKLKQIAPSYEERDEMRQLVDEIVHHRVIDVILDRLPREHHDEFLVIYHKGPHDEEVLFKYLSQKVGENVKEIIRQEIGVLASDLLEDIASSKKKK